MTRVMLSVAAVAAALAFAAPSFASMCPSVVKEIDAALASASNLSEEQRAEVKALRDQGEAQHQAGQHAQSVETLQKAKELLGAK